MVSDPEPSRRPYLLNIDGNAVRNLSPGNEIVEFDARFQGKNWHVSLPVSAVQGIHAEETGAGMIFSDDKDPGPPEPDTPGPAKDRESASTQDRALIRDPW